MYLVSAEQFQMCKLEPKLSPLPSKKWNNKERMKKKSAPQHDYDKWIKIRKKIREKDVTRNVKIKNIANFFKQVLPKSPGPKIESRDEISTTTSDSCE
jgi:hypothetical protein